MRSKQKIIISIFLLFILGCDTNTESVTAAENAHLSGTITFLNINNWPESGYVTISLNESWPPTGAPADYAIIASTDLDTTNQYDYEFEYVSFGTYKAIAVAWENLDSTYNSSCNKSIIGAYGGSMMDYFMSPDSLVTSIDNYLLNNFNFDADFNYAVPNPYSICQPSCANMITQIDCESQGHCMWEETGGCITKQ
tara:strand:+ start:304 stop:891 length:588 start_codon:yes stop_codon:yes gene_type:complete